MEQKDQNFIAQKIRAEYTEKEATHSDVETLRSLDRKVKRPAEIFAYTFGIVGSLVLGTGMSLAMKVIGASLSWGMPVGIAIGLIGLAMVGVTYPLYDEILKKRKAKYADDIIALSDKILNK